MFRYSPKLQHFDLIQLKNKKRGYSPLILLNSLTQQSAFEYLFSRRYIFINLFRDLIFIDCFRRSMWYHMCAMSVLLAYASGHKTYLHSFFFFCFPILISLLDTSIIFFIHDYL